jgi:hypothetical protein
MTIERTALRTAARRHTRRRTGRRWLLATVAAVAGLVLVGGMSRPAAAASPSSTPVRIPDQAVYDLAGALVEDSEAQAESLVAKIGEVADADIVIVVESVDETQTDAAATARAADLQAAMAVGADRSGGGLIVYLGIDPSGCDGQVSLVADQAFAGGLLSDDARRAIVDDDIRPLLAICDPDSAVLVALGRIASIAVGIDSGTGSGAPRPVDDGPPAPPPGPPFPDPTTNVAVYDTATIFRPETIAAAERTIDEIEARTGAEIVVYSQLVEDGRSTEAADGDA